MDEEIDDEIMAPYRSPCVECGLILIIPIENQPATCGACVMKRWEREKDGQSIQD